MHDAKFRAIPSIDELRRRTAARTLEARFGAAALVDALRAAAADARVALRDAAAPADTDDVVARIERMAASRLEAAFSRSLEPVINATGVIVHTNLGRAPLAASALARVAEIAAGYSSLEYDLGRGSRGRRDVHAEPMLCRLTGAEAAVVVNNNAAATLIVLAALAGGREVVVSRGELVEIGGGFRVPDVMAQSGAVLREVGTTNKTRAADYAAAVNDRTALILRVHPSNFRIEGFTERPSLDELVATGRRLNVAVAEDLGSGQLTDIADQPIGRVEPTVAASIAAGVDICCFSGDKLLGGPQAGIIVGRAALVERVRTHPLMRALRVDKMTYAALDATLAEYAAGRAQETVPVQRMLSASDTGIHHRATALAATIGAADGWRANVVEGASTIGGGSAPGIELKTWLVAIERDGLSPDALDARLRRGTPAIVGRIERDRYVLDLRTVVAAQDETIARVVTAPIAV